MFFAFALGDFLAGFSHITFMIPVKRNKLKKKKHTSCKILYVPLFRSPCLH